MFSFFFGPADNLFALALQVCHLLLVLADGLFHLLLAAMDVLALLFPVTLVTHDVL